MLYCGRCVVGLECWGGIDSLPGAENDSKCKTECYSDCSSKLCANSDFCNCEGHGKCVSGCESNCTEIDECVIGCNEI